MARPLRVLREGLTYHVTARGNRRLPIYSDEIDRTRFLDLLEQSVERFVMTCHAFCEMDNHYHALLTTTRPNLSRALQYLNGVYAQWWNTRHGQTGHLFKGRFHARIVQDEAYLVDAARYIALNPVKALIVPHPELWHWSSYRATAGLDLAPSFLDVAAILRCFGADREDARQQYRDFVCAGIPAALLRSSPAGAIAGDRDFVRRVLAGIEASKEVTRSERLQDRPSLQELFTDAARRDVRDASIDAAVVRFGYSMREIAEFLGVHYSTVSRSRKKGSDRARCGNARSDPR